MTPDPIRIWIVEDKAPFRETLAEVIDATPPFVCERAAATCEAALEALDPGNPPDAVLMDLSMPGMGGIAGTRAIKDRCPRTHIIVLTVSDSDDDISEAFLAGASGYLFKPSRRLDIVSAIQEALEGGAPMTPNVAHKMLHLFKGLAQKPTTDYGLTTIEQDVLQWLAREKTKREIADELTRSPHTIDTHIRNIYRKLEVHSRTGAIRKAIREGLVDGEDW